MAILKVIYFTGGALLFSILATGMLRQYSIRHSLLDIPNERSSHSTPTPRGGGLAIVLPVLTCTVLLYYLGLLPVSIVVAFVGGGILVSLTGWLDDHYDIPEIWKAICYVTAATWAVYWLDGMAALKIGDAVITLNFAGGILAILACAWLINLYNFMDGTDALAALQAICTGAFSGFLLMTMGRQDLAIICFVITTASIGFLYWNWPPAKIFMGDVGSCFIGFSFGVLAISGEKGGVLPALVWFILLSVFICDATLTLFLRILKKEKWYSAHRSHAYQRLVQMGASHAHLAVCVLLINVIFLWPIAYIAWRWQQFSLPVLALTVLIMCLLWGIIQWRFTGLSADTNG